MNYLYLNNPTTNRSFNFSKRNEKIDWRRIAAIDVDRVARDLDFQVLQDNIEQIALCNIESEVDYRSMDPNFLKLYKLSQLIIEYLLLCQDQISQQLMENEANKAKNTNENEEYRREMEKLRNELNLTKKESKRRKKLIETQQKMLTTQHPAHQRCPVCGHSFLNGEYLQQHIQRRHPEFDPQRQREHDIDVEKELQRTKDELKSKENELQMIKIQKAVDEERLRERDETIRQHRDEIQTLHSKQTILEGKLENLRSSQSPPNRNRDENLTDLIKQNQALQGENEQLKHNLKQSEKNRKKEEKRLNEKHENETNQLRREIQQLKETLQHAGNNEGLNKELERYRTQYNEEKTLRKRLEKELDEARRELAQNRTHPPPITDRKSPIPPPRSTASPPPPPPPPPPQPSQPAKSTRKLAEILLPQYCPALVRDVNQHEKTLKKYRQGIRETFDDELQQFPGLNIRERDTRLKSDEMKAKMSIIEQARRYMSRDLPEFERIRSDLEAKLDRLVRERLGNTGASSTSIRSSGAKAVKFQDEPRPHVDSIKRPNNPVPSSDDDDDDEKSAEKNYQNDFASDTDEEVPPKKNVQQLVKNLDQKLTQASLVSKKPTINAIAQGFQPSKQSVQLDDESEDDSVTTITANPPAKPTISHIVQKPATYLSSGEMSQNTYDSQLRSVTVKGATNVSSESDDDDEDD